MEVWRGVVGIAACMYGCVEGGMEVWRLGNGVARCCERVYMELGVYGSMEVWRDVVGVATCMYGCLEAWEWRCGCCERVIHGCIMYGGLEVWSGIVGIATCMYGCMEGGMEVWRLGNGTAGVASVYVWMYGGPEGRCECSDVNVWMY